MTTMREFTCDDLFKFNNVNMDKLTETVRFLAALFHSAPLDGLNSVLLFLPSVVLANSDTISMHAPTFFSNYNPLATTLAE